MSKLCLVVTATKDLSQTHRRELSTGGFKSYFVQNLISATTILAQWHFDAVMFNAAGFGKSMPAMLEEVCQHSAAPVLLILDNSDEELQLDGLAAGATEIVVAPISGRLLCAKLSRLIDLSRPRQEVKAKLIQLGPLRLDPRRATATVNGARLGLTPGEFELLVLLGSHPDEFVNRNTIARTLGANSGPESRRSADMHVCRIRRKLKDAGARSVRLETIYGRGYMLRLDAQDSEEEVESEPVEWTV